MDEPVSWREKAQNLFEVNLAAAVVLNAHSSSLLGSDISPDSVRMRAQGPPGSTMWLQRGSEPHSHDVILLSFESGSK